MSATLGPSSEQTKGKLPVEGRVSPQASVSKLGLLCVISPPTTLLLCVILMQMLVNSHTDLSLGSMTHVLDQLPLCVSSSLPVYRVYSDLIAAPPSLRVTPRPSGHRHLPPLSRGEAGQKSSGGRGRDWSGVSFLPTSSLSARIQSFEVTQPSQT